MLFLNSTLWITSGRRLGPDIFHHFFLAGIINLKTMARAVLRFRQPLRDRAMFDGRFDLVILSDPMDLNIGQSGFGGLVMQWPVFTG
ncbi:MAG: hypothetical protein GDA36_10000 [Rhodobacteraceae bacterium]|nr:hypothetical protein [Paracoccaceae bacterium]